MKRSLTGSGYGIFPEVAQLRFKPSIAFNSDNGTSGDTGTTTPPATDPTATTDAEDITGLKSALQKERQLKADFEKRFKQMETLYKDIDPAKYQQLQALQAQAEEWNQKEAQLKSSLDEEWTRKVQAEQTRSKEFEQKYLALQLQTQAEKAYQAANGRSGGGDDGITFFDAFYGNIGNRLKLNEQSQLEVVDEKGARLFSKKDATKPMNAVEFFQDLVKHPVYGHYFAPQNPGKGGGMTPNSGSYQTGTDLSALPAAERLTILRQQQRR